MCARMQLEAREHHEYIVIETVTPSAKNRAVRIRGASKFDDCEVL